MGLRSDLRARAIELAKDGLRPGAIAEWMVVTR
jgi:hypothetical protein